MLCGSRILKSDLERSKKMKKKSPQMRDPANNYKYKSAGKSKIKKLLLIILAVVLVGGGFAGGVYYGWLRFGAPAMKQAVEKSNKNSFYPKTISGKPLISEVNGVYQQDITFSVSLSPKGRDSITKLFDSVEKLTGLKFDSRLYSNENLDLFRKDIPYSKWIAMTEDQRNKESSTLGPDDNLISYSMEAVLAGISNNPSIEKYNLIKDYFVNQGFSDRNSPIGGQKEVYNFWKGNLVCQLSSASTNDNKISLLCGYYDEPQVK